MGNSGKIYLALVAFLAMIATGCGSTDRPVAETSGKVTYQGQGIAGLSVTFMPIGTEENPEPGKMAFAETDSSGGYVLSTYGDQDGAVVGQHRVRIRFDDPFAQAKMKGKFVGPEEVEVESKDNILNFILE